ncbi:uncharacterized protein EDB91DRAFT_821140 [Suillus paluster]|uniref:uncharacterized protein n=1 Tax=Suillus paluster TaxID=48578 RepID=UPI001B85F2E6|nr:uncharacterized protein EDB91DRAFT_821140 [Suillus paluster]KAG1748901.1 hypothetical protein EDB91DRAFT_821140 [Suillus paluster]
MAFRSIIHHSAPISASISLHFRLIFLLVSVSDATGAVVTHEHAWTRVRAFHPRMSSPLRIFLHHHHLLLLQLLYARLRLRRGLYVLPCGDLYRLFSTHTHRSISIKLNFTCPQFPSNIHAGISSSKYILYRIYKLYHIATPCALTRVQGTVSSLLVYLFESEERNESDVRLLQALALTLLSCFRYSLSHRFGLVSV